MSDFMKPENNETKERLFNKFPSFTPGDHNAKVYKECYGINDSEQGRGVFYNEEETFLVWVNENDHLRIMVREEGKMKGAFDRIIRYRSSEFAKSNYVILR